MSIKHYKTRNTGLLFEILINKLIEEMRDGNSKNPAIKIIKKYFSKKNEIFKDLKLYEALSENTTIINSEDVDKYITEIIERDNVSTDKLKKEHYKLCGEIRVNYDMKSFFSTNIKNYITFASIYKLLSFYRNDSNNRIENLKDRMVYENHIKGLLSIPKEIDMKKKERLDKISKLSNFENSLLFITFKNKYEDILTKEQMNIVYKGIKYDVEFFEKERNRLCEKLDTVMEIVNEKLKLRIKEGIEKIKTIIFNKNVPNEFETNVKIILHTHNLLTEIYQLDNISKKKSGQ